MLENANARVYTYRYHDGWFRVLEELAVAISGEKTCRQGRSSNMGIYAAVREQAGCFMGEEIAPGIDSGYLRPRPRVTLMCPNFKPKNSL